MAGLLFETADRCGFPPWGEGGRPLPFGQQWFPLTTESTVIGHDRASDIVVPSEHICRTEARVVRESGGYYLEDKSRTNATSVNRVRLRRRVLLSDGDEIRVGDYVFVFRAHDSPADVGSGAAGLTAPSPRAFSPAWRTGTVLALAWRIFITGDFSPVPILADALQDAGCDNPHVLDHCRGAGPHVRGCWAVGLVLGKE